MNASQNASAQVNGLNGNAASKLADWQRHAAAMLQGANKSAFAACKFMQAMINDAACNASTAALDWCRRAAASKAPITAATAKRCLKVTAAALYGTVSSEKAGYTIPASMPEVADWTIDSLQAAIKQGTWKARAGELLSMWNGRTPIRIEKSVQQKSAQEKLEALAKQVARLMVKEGFDLATVEKAITAAKATCIVK